MTRAMRAEQLAAAEGWAQTRETLERWRAAPGRPLRGWASLALLVALGLLVAVWLRAATALPDPTPREIVGVTRPATLGDLGFVLARNGLVLALHALACVAGFMAGAALPRVARGYGGAWRRLHELAGPAAIAFVVVATAFSLVTQAVALGRDTADLALQLGVPPAHLLAVVSLHALPELFALFLPLAAWTLASRRRAWGELLAATLVTVTVAVPLLLAAGAVEVWITPRLLSQL